MRRKEIKFTAFFFSEKTAKVRQRGIRRGSRSLPELPGYYSRRMVISSCSKRYFFYRLPQYNARALFRAPKNERSKTVSKDNNNKNIYSLSAEKFGYIGKMVLKSTWKYFNFSQRHKYVWYLNNGDENYLLYLHLSASTKTSIPVFSCWKIPHLIGEINQLMLKGVVSNFIVLIKYPTCFGIQMPSSGGLLVPF
jgi:hypothetical protein